LQDRIPSPEAHTRDMRRRWRPFQIHLALAGCAAALGVLLLLRRPPPASEPGGRALRERANRTLDLALAARPESAPVLVAALADRSTVVRDNALFGLRRITGLAWRARTAECLSWWNGGGAGGAAPPAGLRVRESPTARDPDMACGLERLSAAEVLLGDETVSLAARWFLVHSGSRPAVLRDAPRDVHFAHRLLPDGGAALADESCLPWAWATVTVRGVAFGPDARPRELACEAGRTLDGTRLAPGQCFGETVSWPIPGSGDENAGYSVFEIRLRVEPYFTDGVPGVPWAAAPAAPVFATARPRWRAESPHLSPADRGRVIEGARAAGVSPRSLAVFRLEARPPTGEGRDGTSIARAFRGRLDGPRSAPRPWLYVAGVGWVQIEETGATAPGTGPLVETLTVEAALPGVRPGDLAWAAEME